MGKQRSVFEWWVSRTQPLLSALSKVMLGFSGMCTVVMTVVVTYSVIMRYVFDRPQLWAFSLAAYAMIGVGMFALGPALLHDEHVRVKILLDALPRRAERVLSGVGILFSIPLVVIVIWYGWKLTETSRRFGFVDQEFMKVPIWLTQIPVVVGMGLFALFILWLGTVLVWAGIQGRAELFEFGGKRPSPGQDSPRSSDRTIVN